MEKTKCISCGHEFDEKVEVKKLKVTLNNPGDVFFEGNVVTCPNCDKHSAKEEDINNLAEAFDKAHAEKYSKFKNISA